MTDRQTPAAERLDSLDLLRGFALLGILAMNMQSYAMPGAAYFFPLAWGDMGGLNGAVWWITDVLADSKFIAIFSLLFGAGVVLMNDRAKAAGRGFASLHYRRMLVLLGFGLVHSYLMWSGDILVSYAVCGCFVFLFRNVRPSRTFATGVLLLAIGVTIMCLVGLLAPTWPEEVQADVASDFMSSPEELLEEQAAMKGGFASQNTVRFEETFGMHVVVIPSYMFWRASGTMLLGMALFKWGFLTGRSRRRTYRTVLLLGVLVGLPLVIWGNLRSFAVDWDVIPTFLTINVWNYTASLLVAAAWISGLLLIREAGALDGLRERMAAMGRMALTNYLSQTFLAGLIFYGHGLGLFGDVSRVGQAGLVAAIWALQLWWSKWWMDRFRFGPVEWLWRSMVYVKRQPMAR